MPLPRRRLLAWLAALLAGTFTRQAPIAAEPSPTRPDSGAADPVFLVDGWLLRQSDLEALANSQERHRHDP